MLVDFRSFQVALLLGLPLLQAETPSGELEVLSKEEKSEDQKLINQGEKAYPELLHMLFEEGIAQGEKERIVRVLEEGNGDKRIIRDTARRMLPSPDVLPTKNLEPVVSPNHLYALILLGSTGAAEDLPAIRKWLHVGNAREVALNSLAQLGDRRAQYLLDARKSDEYDEDRILIVDIARDVPTEDRVILDHFLIPPGQSEKDIEKQIQKVRTMGESAYPALRRELFVGRSAAITDPILEVLKNGEDYPEPARVLLRQIVRERKSDCRESAQLRETLIEQFAIYGGVPERELLHELLKDPDFGVQDQSVQSLAEIGDESSGPFLREWLKQHPQLELRAEWAIQKTSKSLEDRRILSLITRRKEEQLIAMGAKAYPALCRELEVTKDAEWASRIVEVIRKFKGDKSLPLAAIRKLQERGDWKNQGYAVRLKQEIILSLGYFGTKEDLSFLHSALRDSEELTSYKSLESLARIGDLTSVEAIRAWQKETPRDPKNTMQKGLDQAAEQTINAIQQRQKARKKGK